MSNYSAWEAQKEEEKKDILEEIERVIVSGVTEKIKDIMDNRPVGLLSSYLISNPKFFDTDIVSRFMGKHVLRNILIEDERNGTFSMRQLCNIRAGALHKDNSGREKNLEVLRVFNMMSEHWL